VVFRLLFRRGVRCPEGDRNPPVSDSDAFSFLFSSSSTRRAGV